MNIILFANVSICAPICPVTYPSLGRACRFLPLVSLNASSDVLRSKVELFLPSPRRFVHPSAPHSQTRIPPEIAVRRRSSRPNYGSLPRKTCRVKRTNAQFIHRSYIYIYIYIYIYVQNGAICLAQIQICRACRNTFTAQERSRSYKEK